MHSVYLLSMLYIDIFLSLIYYSEYVIDCFCIPLTHNNNLEEKKQVSKKTELYKYCQMSFPMSSPFGLNCLMASLTLFTKLDFNLFK